ncbi:MAG: crossover junction endodeoxyribonuclease RuvC [Candidatus Poribacteria bacterium]|nr:crossover junction endodeoxyribonuclease RuvC [Candidatus Poribacteria bacterium]
MIEKYAAIISALSAFISTGVVVWISLKTILWLQSGASGGLATCFDCSLLTYTDTKLQKVKSAVTGTGKASKEAVRKMVNKLLGSDIRNGNGYEADAAAYQ